MKSTISKIGGPGNSAAGADAITWRCAIRTRECVGIMIDIPSTATVGSDHGG